MSKRVRRKRDPLAGKKHPPFGATKAQGRQFQRERDLKNRIFELEQGLAAAEQIVADERMRTHEARRIADAARPDARVMLALRTICHMPAFELTALGIALQVMFVSQWIWEMDHPGQTNLATVKQAAVVDEPPTHTATSRPRSPNGKGAP